MSSCIISPSFHQQLVTNLQCMSQAGGHWAYQPAHKHTTCHTDDEWTPSPQHPTKRPHGIQQLLRHCNPTTLLSQATARTMNQTRWQLKRCGATAAPLSLSTSHQYQQPAQRSAVPTRGSGSSGAAYTRKPSAGRQWTSTCTPAPDCAALKKQRVLHSCCHQGTCLHSCCHQGTCLHSCCPLANSHARVALQHTGRTTALQHTGHTAQRPL
jgi:hypothetical protein